MKSRGHLPICLTERKAYFRASVFLHALQVLHMSCALLHPSATASRQRWLAHPLQMQRPGYSAGCGMRDIAEDKRNTTWISNYNQLIDATKLSVAPMMEYTDRHFRHLVRLISRRTLLYTEMVPANAIARERQHHMEIYQAKFPDAGIEIVRSSYEDEYIKRFLEQGRVEPLEGPSVLQLGGSDPQQLYEAAQTVVDLSRRDSTFCNYTAFNLNCGCPSPKVAGKGCFGAALMDDPKLVAHLVRAIHEGCEGQLPVTVKCRIGTDSKRHFTRSSYNDIDPEEEYRELCRFIECVAADGVVTDFSVHARIAVLSKSFTPADNRKIPPLKYEVVRRLVRDYPELTFSLNGGIENIRQVEQELKFTPGLKGVMIGRSWVADPWSFAMTDHLLYGDTNLPARNRWEVLEQYGKHADAEEAIHDPIMIRRFIVKAITPLFAGEKNAKRYRIALDEIAGLPKARKGDLQGLPPLSELIMNVAVKHLSEEALLRSPQESYERVLWEEGRQSSDRANTVIEWQMQREASN